VEIIKTDNEELYVLDDVVEEAIGVSYQMLAKKSQLR
jgi:hypothetical protein